MKTTVTKSDFRDAFNSIRPNNFSYDGLGTLYDFIEEMDDAGGTESELDVIAYCCEFAEYESLEEFHKDYDKEDYPTIEDIQDNTLFIPIDDDSFIIQCF